MVFLMVILGRETSATHIIAHNIAECLAKDNEIHIANTLQQSSNKPEFCKKMISCTLNKVDPVLSDLFSNSEYKNRSFIRKILFLVFNPHILYRYIVYKVRCFLSLILSPFSALQLSIYCAINRIDVVIGFTEPYYNAELVSAIVGKTTKCLFQCDPYSSSFETELNNRNKTINREKKIIRKIDYIFTVKTIIDDMHSDGIYDASKIIMTEFPLITGIVNKVDRPFFIKEKDLLYFAHVGSFYKSIRDPRILVDFFAKLPDNCILVVAGYNTEMIMKYEKKVSGRIIDLGLLAPDDSKKLMRYSDFNISFNNKVANMVPSKLFDYINTGRPLINLCQISDCPTLQYTKKYELAVNVMLNDEFDVKLCVDFINKNKGKELSGEYIVQHFRECSVEYVSNTIYNVIKKRQFEK